MCISTWLNIMYIIIVLLSVIILKSQPSSSVSDKLYESKSERISKQRKGDTRQHCPSDGFSCSSDLAPWMSAGGECLDMNQVCNDVPECTNGWDESVPVCGCPKGLFECNNGTCIDGIRRCDVSQDCPDGEDELNCEVFECPRGRIKCDNDACIPAHLHCNFVDDCGDGSDEENCEYRECYESEFRCDNGQCILAFLCDGQFDCLDHSDENNCESHVRCENGFYVDGRLRCDGWVDCIHSMDDELGCPCDTKTHFLCENTRCVDQGNVCDGVCDCGAGCEDEQNCGSDWSSRFACLGHSLLGGLDINYTAPPAETRLLQPEYLCDGVNHCRNDMVGHDEEGCVYRTLNWECHASCENPDRQCNPDYFQCFFAPTQDGACSHHQRPSSRCDGVRDCLSGNDERDCNASACTDEEWACEKANQCISEVQRCDGIIHCLDATDETKCLQHSCQSNEFRCQTGQCISPEKRCNWVRDCLDGSDEIDCDIGSCTTEEFRCSNGQCISRDLVCHIGEGQQGCHDNSHLLNCSATVCSVDKLKCRNSYCVPLSHMCDIKVDCLPALTDEETCPYPCPFPTTLCECQNDAMICEGRELTTIPHRIHENGLFRYFFSRNNLTLDNATLSQHSQIIYLDASWNSVSVLQPQTFSTLYNMQTLNLDNNNISRLLANTFDGLYSLSAIYLIGNTIEHIDPFAFNGTSSLKVLNLSHQRLKEIYRNSFVGLLSLQTLNLSHNKIRYIDDGAFNGLVSLSILDLSHNQLYFLSSHTFNGLRQLNTLYLQQNKLESLDENVFYGLNPVLRTLITDEFRFCCVARFVGHCEPAPDEFSSCEDLMSNNVLRLCIWVLGVGALCGNLLVLIWRLCDSRDSKVHSFLISQLALADMLMGVYLLIIASVDAYFRGAYGLHASAWRASPLCRLAGMLCALSSELSVFTLTVITMDRFVAITFPFCTRRLNMQQARLLMAGLWSLALLLSVIPLLGLDYFHEFYGRSGVCLALHITPSRPPGWQYSVAVFLILNLLSFLAIAGAYLCMFVVVWRSRSATRGPEARSEQALARRMSVIVGTDFCCWVPISLLGLSSLAGASIPPQVYAWVAVFVLPLNSAVNPVLYTISTAAFLSQAKRRMFRFRMSFTSSQRDTRSTQLSYHEDRHQMWERRPVLRHALSHPVPAKPGLGLQRSLTVDDTTHSPLLNNSSAYAVTPT